MRIDELKAGKLYRSCCSVENPIGDKRRRHGAILGRPVFKEGVFYRALSEYDRMSRYVQEFENPKDPVLVAKLAAASRTRVVQLLPPGSYDPVRLDVGRGMDEREAAEHLNAVATLVGLLEPVEEEPLWVWLEENGQNDLACRNLLLWLGESKNPPYGINAEAIKMMFSLYRESLRHGT